METFPQQPLYFKCIIAVMTGLGNKTQDNPFGHPDDKTLDRLDGVVVYRTDEEGTITFTSDGERLWVETEYSVSSPTLRDWCLPGFLCEFILFHLLNVFLFELAPKWIDWVREVLSLFGLNDHFTNFSFPNTLGSYIRID